MGVHDVAESGAVLAGVVRSRRCLLSKCLLSAVCAMIPSWLAALSAGLVAPYPARFFDAHADDRTAEQDSLPPTARASLLSVHRAGEKRVRPTSSRVLPIPSGHLYGW